MHCDFAGSPVHAKLKALPANPETVSVVLAVAPGALTFSVVAPTETVGDEAATVIERLVEAVAGILSESVTCTVKLLTPGWVGVPVIAPVLAFRARPAGKVPLATVQVNGANPFCSVNVCA